MRLLHLCLYLSALCGATLAQGQYLRTPFNQQFRFADGVYFNFETLRSNQPMLAWSAVDGALVHNPEDYIVKIEHLRLAANGRPLPLDSVWAVVIEGIPYLYVPAEETGTGSGFATFAGLRVRGRICFFDYEAISTRMVTISAYNPVTGRPFRTGKVPKQETRIVEKILHWDRGEIAEFSKPNLLGWIKDDEYLFETVYALTEKEAEEKLFKCLLIYVDRNPAYLEEQP